MLAGDHRFVLHPYAARDEVFTALERLFPGEE
jgi:hypothetical protein